MDRDLGIPSSDMSRNVISTQARERSLRRSCMRRDDYQ